MQPIQPFDPSTATYGTVPGVMLPNGGSIVLINKSPYELWVTFESRDTMDVPAWTARLYQTCERVTAVTWQYAQGWTPSGQSGAPSSLVSLELYGPQEKVPENYPVALTRLVSVGNQLSTTGSTSMKNDGQAPGTSLIEATPSDQAASAIQINNDGSGLWKILSAGALRTLLNIVRGNATTGKASIQLGDNGDTTITTFYGTVGAGSAVPASTVAGDLTGATLPTANIDAGALPAGVTIAGSQVTGDIAASQVGPGTLDADVVVTSAAQFYDPAHDTIAAITEDAAQFLHLNRWWKGVGGTGVKGFSKFAGVGSGTFNHNYGATPDGVQVTTNQGGSSQTMGVDTLGATTVHVTTGNGYGWYGIAYGLT